MERSQVQRAVEAGRSTDSALGIGQCRLLMWAMITTWRWQRDDQLPNGRYWRIEGLNQIRAALNGPGPDVLSDRT